MSRSSFVGYIRSYGSTKKATPAVLPNLVRFTLDPTQASSPVGVTLPKGTIIIQAGNLNGGGTGGSSPTFDIGTESDPDGLVVGVPADTIQAQFGNGALSSGEALTQDTPVYAGVGASAATGGEVKGSIIYVMEDDQK